MGVRVRSQEGGKPVRGGTGKGEMEGGGGLWGGGGQVRAR